MGISRRLLDLLMTATGILVVSLALATTGDKTVSAAPPASSASHVIVDSGSITVDNPSLPVRNLDEPARNGFQIPLPNLNGETWPQGFLSFTTRYVPLPAGKRAVIELVSARIAVPQGQRPMASLERDGAAPVFIPLTFEGSGWGTDTDPLDIYVASHSLKLYLDAGQSVRFRADRPTPATGAAYVETAVISGYAVDP
jgi:hypothetical protein